MVTNHYFPFSIRLALLAAKRDYLNYDSWLKDNYMQYGNGFITYLLTLIRKKFLKSYKYNQSDNLDFDYVLEKA